MKKILLALISITFFAQTNFVVAKFHVKSSKEIEAERKHNGQVQNIV